MLIRKVLLMALLTALTLVAMPNIASAQSDSTGESELSETTTTLSPDGDVGRIIPLPNSGRDPLSDTDRGGSLQIGLFLVICLVILGIGGWVWLRSRRMRMRRSAAGHDPVDMAKTRGADVRKS